MNNILLKIKAIDRETGEEEWINDLYWFEEFWVHDFYGNGITNSYNFEVYLEDKLIYSTKVENGKTVQINHTVKTVNIDTDLPKELLCDCGCQLSTKCSVCDNDE